MIFLNVNVFICLQTIVIAVTLISVEAYDIKRDGSSNVDVTSYRESHSRNFFLNEPFIDKTIGLQISAAVPVRDQTTGQRAFRDVPLKNRAIYPSGLTVFHHQPIKQNSFKITSFRDKLLYKDAILKNQQLRGEPTVLTDNPLEEQWLTPEEISEGQTSTYGSQAPFKEQLFTTETPFKNLFRGQSSSAEQALQKQKAFVESPSISNSVKFYRDNSYIKPIDLYERYKNLLTSFDGNSLIHTKYDNHVPKLSSVLMVPSSEYLPLNAETPTTQSSMPFIVHGHNSAMSSVSSGMSDSSEASKVKLGPRWNSLTSISNCNAPVDSLPTTVPSISVSTNQSSIVGHILTSLTTKPSSPVLATSIAPSGNVLEPIYFHATKHGSITYPLRTLSDNSDMHAHTSSHIPTSLKINEHNVKFLEPEALKNVETQSSTLNYILPEEHKAGLKDIQTSLMDYTLPVKVKHHWPLQQFSEPEISSGYAPLSLNSKMKRVLPNIPIAPISWPIEIKNDVSTTLPLKSIMTSNAVAKNKLLLGTHIDLPVDFTASIPNSLTSNTPNGISGSITGGISTSIPGSMTMDIPASIPTLNFGQTLHHVEQLRSTQEARNPWYPTGLQLQLGGFDGINYTLHTDNPAMRPIEPGIGKAGLTSPKLAQPHALAFAKIGVGYHL
ncbi:uncharacterized protein [Mycetomoellerius zeteki]|uniref:uncharacterized protein n=1 Tax=Mycetomoellerius zeteki TaxID=64791 RepID=UPI00084E8F2A|nr:PREDICTED: uncharacterized protein LOC108726050 [Trachymyrmex zeteki]